jgi:hypothetical protein
LSKNKEKRSNEQRRRSKKVRVLAKRERKKLTEAAR